MIEIEAPGPRATVQDLGRPGYAALGVGRSGAADRGALRLANRLVGNPERLAGLELTFGGLRARFREPVLAAVTGAPCPVDLEGGPAGGAPGMNAPFQIRAGQLLRIGTPDRGLRTYLAVRGGIDVPQVLGSRSTDTLCGIGPAALEPGMLLPIGRGAADFPNTDLAPRPEPSGDALAVLPGPRADRFTPEAISVLIASTYTVTPDTDRVGARLDGPRLERATPGEELRSEGMVRGALQVPPDGRPILFLADHPVTGGYPVIAVVRGADLDRAAQLRPGDAVRFRLG